ncbi:MAG TPA: imidazole glycerol phosphate synthase subunit HisH [Vicinamibacterales bacterium]|nr:imidazole glycerol phosphate synthase subunit HisH [Vicinamibacterales bacterium]
MIALIDYGAGNLTSVRKALTSLGADYAIPASPAELVRYSAIIVPGVGNFAATEALVGPWRDAIGAEVRSGKPLFGICLGMQWLFEGSEEAPEVPGLGVLPGRVTRLQGDAAQRLKIPHVGWNALAFHSSAELAGQRCRILAGLEDGAHVYFTHSFAAPVTDACVAATTHSETFAAVVERDNVFGVQFHPEKSSDAGLQIMRNFLEVVRRLPAAARSAEAGC